MCWLWGLFWDSLSPYRSLLIQGIQSFWNPFKIKVCRDQRSDFWTAVETNSNKCNICPVFQLFTQLFLTFAGHVRLHARGERHAVRDPGSGKGPPSYPLGAAGLRRAVHLFQEVLHHFPHHPVSFRHVLRPRFVFVFTVADPLPAPADTSWPVSTPSTTRPTSWSTRPRSWASWSPSCRSCTASGSWASTSIERSRRASGSVRTAGPWARRGRAWPRCGGLRRAGGVCIIY